MNKPAIALGGALAAALLGLPPVLGMMTEAQVTRRVESLRDHPLLVAELQSFERGWFGSEARIELGLSPAYVAQLAAEDPDVPAEALERRAVIVVDMAHGPIAVGHGVHFGLSSFVARPDPQTAGLADLLARLRMPYLFEFRGFTGLSGALTFDADVPPFEVSEPGRQLSFTGARLDGSLDGTAIEYEARAERLRAASSGGPSVSLEGLRSSARLDMFAPYLALGTMDAEMDRLQIWDPAAEPVLDASGLRMDSEWQPTESGDRLNGVVTYTLANAKTGDGELVDAAFGVGVRNVDLQAVQAYQEVLQRAVAAGTDDSALVAEIEPVVQRFLAGSPSIVIEPFRFRWQGEQFDASVLVEVDGNAVTPAGAFDLANPVLLVGAIDATAHVNVSKKLAEDVAARVLMLQLAAAMGGEEPLPPEQLEYMAGAQAGLMLVSLVGQGLLVDDGTSYSTRVEFNDGALTVNGNPLPFGLP